MLALLRKSRLFFGITTAVALAVRIIFALKFHRVDGDSLIYGDIARNWLIHGIFGLSTAAGPLPTYIRLPGYPAFLAAIWSFTGTEHYTAVLVAQIVVDLGTCFLVADLARRIASVTAARIAFLLATVCPFFATYVATPLTETLAIFFAALALDSACAGLDRLRDQHLPQSAKTGYLGPWAVCGMAVSASILLRPDGGILLAAVAAYLVWVGLEGSVTSVGRVRKNIRNPWGDPTWRSALIAAVVLCTVSLTPLIPWTVRNWHVFHRFQPLAPRYANAPDEPVNYGFQRWTRTWMLDFVSVAEIYWNVPEAPIDPALLPNRAFDSPEQRTATEDLFSEYEATGKWTADLDSRLGQIADQRIRNAPLRYYVWLPAGRIADMWLRPRTELLGINDRWWEFRDDPKGAFWASLLGIVNFFYLAAAVIALFSQRKNVRYIGLLALFIVLRSVFLGTLENPEPRYTLECYPAIIVLAAAALSKRQSPRKTISVPQTAFTHKPVGSETT